MRLRTRQKRLKVEFNHGAENAAFFSRSFLQSEMFFETLSSICMIKNRWNSITADKLNRRSISNENRRLFSPVRGLLLRDLMPTKKVQSLGAAFVLSLFSPSRDVIWKALIPLDKKGSQVDFNHRRQLVQLHCKWKAEPPFSSQRSSFKSFNGT